MSANDLTRDELIACLDWQVACGADEAIGNQATHDQPFVSLKSFLSTPSAAGQVSVVGARRIPCDLQYSRWLPPHPDHKSPHNNKYHRR